MPIAPPIRKGLRGSTELREMSLPSPESLISKVGAPDCSPRTAMQIPSAGQMVSVWVWL